MIEYNRGSEWRKRDLQVQTILDDWYISISTYLEDLKTNFPDKVAKLINIIWSEELIKKYDSKEYFFTDPNDNEKTRARNYSKLLLNYIDIFHDDVGAIWITDHNYYHDYLIDELVLESNNTNIKVIPWVEVNISWVHVLVFFWEKPYLKDTYSEWIKTFLSKINIDAPQTGDSLTVSNNDCHTVINIVNNELDWVIIYPHCNSNNWLFQERGRTDRTHLANIYNKQSFNILQAQNYSSANTTARYITSNNSLKSWHVFTLCSDSRCIKDILRPDNQNNYTRIKSDPTFEWLKQILYESKERVILQEENPSLKFDKPFFSEININKDISVFNDPEDELVFQKTKIFLNKNLVTIIGWRWTGKSRLVDYMSNIFDKYGSENKDYNFNKEFSLLYSKNNISDPDTIKYLANEKNYLDFIYISQDTLKEKSKKNNIEDNIKSLLKISGSWFSPSLNLLITNLLDSIKKNKEWFQELDEDWDETNNRKRVEEFKKEHESLLKSIETKDNKEKLETYIKNIESIQTYIDQKDNLLELKNDLGWIIEINEDIKEINKTLPVQEADFEKIPELTISKQIKSIEKNRQWLEKKITHLKEDNKEIKEWFEKSWFRGDLESLLKNAEDYKSNIKFADSRLKDIKKQEKSLDTKIKDRKNLGIKIQKEYERLENSITESWKNIFDDYTEEQKSIIDRVLLQNWIIKIDGKILFNKDQFYELLSERLDWRKYKKQSLENHFKIYDFKSWIDYLKKIPWELLDEEFEEIQEVFFDLYLRWQYIRAVPDVTYNNKPLKKVSVWQRGTALLCLQLATDAFSKPIIFDQPEDDLDNEFIMSNLVKIFKELKQYRQIIIVTHNANLVVNSDAEQIIVARNEEEQLSYISWSLENKEIQKQVCTILEWWEQAFEQRKKRYNLK